MAEPSICTMSLGRCFAGHSLQHKLDMAQKHGFKAIELFYEDLVALAEAMPGGATQANQLSSAKAICEMCRARSLSIICLQPFMQYEGLIDRELHHQRVQEMEFWIKLVHALGTDLIMLPSSSLPSDQVSQRIDVIVEDMAEIAEIGLQSSPIVRFAFEALCWGTRVDVWEASWEVVRQVDRPNFGICLDTFNIAGRLYADPATISGRTPFCDLAIQRSMSNLLSSVTLNKVFLLQIADGERLLEPLNAQHEFYDPDQPPRMSWSRNARLFYGESQHGGYLPVREIMDTIMNRLGYKGWVSFEVFNRRLTERDHAIPEQMAKRAASSWQKLKMDLSLDSEDLQSLAIQAML